MSKATQFIREWWATLRYGSRFTRAGRALRRNLRDPFTDEFYVDAPPLVARNGVNANPGGMIMGVDHDFAPGGPQDTPLGGPR